MKLPIISTPKHTVTLPNSSKKVVISCASYGQMTNFLTSLFTSDDSMISIEIIDVFLSELVNTNCKSLSEIDKIFLIFQIRKFTISNELNLTFICPHCNSTSTEFTIDVDEIEYFAPDLSNVVVFEGTTVGIDVIQDTAILKDNHAGEDVLDLLNNRIRSVFDGEKVFSQEKDYSKFVNTLGYSQVTQAIEAILSKPSIKIDKDVTCVTCDTKSKIQMVEFKDIFF